MKLTSRYKINQEGPGNRSNYEAIESSVDEVDQWVLALFQSVAVSDTEHNLAVEPTAKLVSRRYREINSCILVQILDKSTRVGKGPLEECVCLRLDHLVPILKLVQLVLASQMTVEDPTLVPHALAIRSENKVRHPSKEFSGHWKVRSVRIDRTPLVQKISGDFQRVDNDNSLTKGADRDEVA